MGADRVAVVVEESTYDVAAGRGRIVLAVTGPPGEDVVVDPEWEEGGVLKLRFRPHSVWKREELGQ